MTSHECKIVYIDKVKALEDLVVQLLKEKYVCVDTEFVRDETFFPQLCLIQIRSEKLPFAYCIDTLALSKDNLRDILILPLFYNSNVIKVFHSASQDLEALHFLAEMPNQLITPIFDTAIGWKYLSPDASISYKNLVSNYLNITLDQSETRSNWLRRPLTKKQIQYAADDVIYLSVVYEQMHKELSEKQRLQQAQKEFHIETVQYCKVPDVSKGFKSIKKRGPCNTEHKREKLYYVAAWREVMAMKYDCPRRWLLTDEQVVNIALQLSYIEEKKKEMYVFFENFHYRSPARALSNDSLNEELSEFLNTNNIPSYACIIEEKKEEEQNGRQTPYCKEFWKEREILKKDIMERVKNICKHESMYYGCLLNQKQLGMYLNGDESIIDDFRAKFLKKLLHEATCQYLMLIEKFSKEGDNTTTAIPEIPKPKGIIKNKLRTTK